jgi:hypothetical protein
LVDRADVIPVPVPTQGDERIAGEFYVQCGDYVPEQLPSSDNIVETGLPYSRRYDPTEELARIRGIYAAEAAGARAPRAPSASFHTRSLRRI